MSQFCQVTKDEHLLEYTSLDELLAAGFYPGNYDPTKDQAKQLIRCAVLSALRWVQLHKLDIGELTCKTEN